MTHEFVPCPKCGKHWARKSTYKIQGRNVCYRRCHTCGYSARYGENGEEPLFQRRQSIPCPKCGATWKRCGVNPGGRVSRCCVGCGYSATTDEEGNVLRSLRDKYECLDCNAPLKFTKRLAGAGAYTCPACGLEHFRSYSEHKLIRLADRPKKTGGYVRKPLTEDALQAQAAKKAAREARAKERYRLKKEKQAIVPAPSKVTVETLPQLPVMAAARAARQRVEALREQKELLGCDPLFAGVESHYPT